MINLTKAELELHTAAELEDLIAYAGSVSHLARMLDYNYMTVKSWEEAGRISKEGARLVEAHKKLGKKFTAIELRPDL